MSEVSDIEYLEDKIIESTGLPREEMQQVFSAAAQKAMNEAFDPDIEKTLIQKSAEVLNPIMTGWALKSPESPIFFLTWARPRNRVMARRYMAYWPSYPNSSELSRKRFRTRAKARSFVEAHDCFGMEVYELLFLDKGAKRFLRNRLIFGRKYTVSDLAGQRSVLSMDTVNLLRVKKVAKKGNRTVTPIGET